MQFSIVLYNFAGSELNRQSFNVLEPVEDEAQVVQDALEQFLKENSSCFGVGDSIEIEEMA